MEWNRKGEESCKNQLKKKKKLLLLLWNGYNLQELINTKVRHATPTFHTNDIVKNKFLLET